MNWASKSACPILWNIDPKLLSIYMKIPSMTKDMMHKDWFSNAFMFLVWNDHCAYLICKLMESIQKTLHKCVVKFINCFPFRHVRLPEKVLQIIRRQQSNMHKIDEGWFLQPMYTFKSCKIDGSKCLASCAVMWGELSAMFFNKSRFFSSDSCNNAQSVQ